jgi:ParB/RepB/Spo0J family partition protein
MGGDGILRDGTHLIPLSEIYAVKQDRQDFNDVKLELLAADMGASGQAQAIMVRPKPCEQGRYVIIFGERRVRAARMLGWQDIRAEVRDIDDLEVARLQYSENQARVDLNPIEDARAIRRRMQAEGWNFVQAAAGLGRRETSLHERVKLLDLIEPMVQMLELGQVKVSFGVAMIRLNTEMQWAAYGYLQKEARPQVASFERYCDQLYMRQQQATLLPLEEFEQGLPSAYSTGPSGTGDAGAENSGTESVPAYSPHPGLPKLPRGKSVGIVLEKYIEQLREDSDPVRQEAARVVEHVYGELRAANKIRA